MLFEQSKEVESLRAQLANANARLGDRRILIGNAGSIAEAALQLNGVFGIFGCLRTALFH